MKTENEIIAEDELIAKFMGLVRYEADSSYSKAQYYKPSQDKRKKGHFVAYYDGLRYNEKWDWLMPVVEAIEEIELPHPSNNPEKGTVWPFQFEILSRNQVQIIDNRDDEAIVTTGTPEGCKTKMESVYRAVVEFIKWYNSQNS